MVNEFGKTLWYALKLNIKVSPMYFIIVCLIGLAHGVLFGFSVLSTQLFFDTTALAISNSNYIRVAYIWAFILGITLISRELANGFHNLLQNDIESKVGIELKSIVHEKMNRLPAIMLEDTKLHDDIHKAIEGAGAVLENLTIVTMIITFHLPYFLFLSIYLHSLQPRFIIFLLLIFIPIMVMQFARRRISEKFEDVAAPINREFWDCNNSIVSRAPFMETRTLGAYGFFIKRFMGVMDRLTKAEFMTAKKNTLLEFILSIIRAIGYLGILYMLVVALLSGEISVGAFGAVFAAIGTLFWIMQQLMGNYVGSTMENMGKARNFMRFIDLQERSSDNDYNSDVVKSDGIYAKNISFSYPHSSNKSIDNVSVSIKKGEVVALVGANGSGKTTLARILMGIYLPNTGSVTTNGIDTASISGVFQDFQCYQMTLEENIKIAELSSNESVQKALLDAHIDINTDTYPNGLDTILAREFGGVELSGGQWQRIAIARGLYKNHDMIVLDEPTASIDPIEESRVYNQFIEMIKGKSALLITHRLGSVKIADRIIVMDDGKIIEEGTHMSLIKDNGLYAQMYNAQSEWYELSG